VDSAPGPETKPETVTECKSMELMFSLSRLNSRKLITSRSPIQRIRCGRDEPEGTTVVAPQILPLADRADPGRPARTADAYSSADVSTGIVGSTHSLPATFPETQNARSLLGGPVRTVGTYSRLRRCGRSPALLTAASSDTTTVVEPNSRAVDGTRDRVFDELVGRWQSVHRRYGQWRLTLCHQAELFGRIVRVHL
jgi:hypothetical protein